MRLVRFSHLLGTILLLLFAGSARGIAQAASNPVGTMELARQSEVVAVGKVSSLKCDWSPGKTQILTHVTIDVQECVKGSLTGQQLTVVTPGGEIGEEGELYCGVARFARNEQVLLFAKKMNANQYTVTGGMNGKFTITQDAVTKTKLVGPSLRLNDVINQVKAASEGQKGKEERP